MVQEKVLSKLDSKKLSVFVVWLPFVRKKASPVASGTRGVLRGLPMRLSWTAKEAAWGLDVEARNKWHLFRKIGKEWRHQGRFHGVSKGREEELMRAFAERGGLLPKVDALRLARRAYSRGEVDQLMAVIKPDMARLRASIRKALGLTDKTVDPLPFDNTQKSWRLKSRSVMQSRRTENRAVASPALTARREHPGRPQAASTVAGASPPSTS